MAAAHLWLGLGEFPDTEITFYLTRSTSLLYAVHGAMMTYVAITIEHHWRMVWVFGWLHILIGLSMLGIDLLAPMPWYWTAAEGLPVAILGGIIIVLANRSNFSDIIQSKGSSDEATAI